MASNFRFPPPLPREYCLGHGGAPPPNQLMFLRKSFPLRTDRSIYFTGAATSPLSEVPLWGGPPGISSAQQSVTSVLIAWCQPSATEGAAGWRRCSWGQSLQLRSGISSRRVPCSPVVVAPLGPCISDQLLGPQEGSTKTTLLGVRQMHEKVTLALQWTCFRRWEEWVPALQGPGPSPCLPCPPQTLQCPASVRASRTPVSPCTPAAG